MVGGFPRKEGMERKDVMSKNVSIYKSQASALEKHAAANCKVNEILKNRQIEFGYLLVIEFILSCIMYHLKPYMDRNFHQTSLEEISSNPFTIGI
jgi:hypothetical protein